jgi:hypothetical protein
MPTPREDVDQHPQDNHFHIALRIITGVVLVDITVNWIIGKGMK